MKCVLQRFTILCLETLTYHILSFRSFSFLSYRSSNYELELETKTKETRYLLVNATTRRDQDGNTVGVVGVAQDVTETKKNENAITAVARELRQLVDTANAPIFGIDTNGLVNEWNNKTAEITGFSRDEAYGRPLVSTFIKENLRSSVKSVMDNALKGNESSNYELELETKTKETRYLLVNATTRRGLKSQVTGVVGVAQDVTDDRKHSAELQKMHSMRASQEAKVETERNMTAYFAHELRNPLHAIDIALNLMPSNLETVEHEAYDLCQSMKLCTSFMSSIMNNLLDVRKMEEGKMNLHLKATSISAIIGEVEKMLRPSVKSGVKLILKLVDLTENDWVMADAHRLQQIYTNVITNAIKYTSKGSITLSFRWDGNFGVFHCVDTGPGIPKSEQKDLFGRFVQRGGAPGTGLGLAIAKHLVDICVGSIHFISDPSVAPGTTCVVRIPFTKCAQPTKARIEESEQANEPIKRPLRFLIIDDISINRSMLKRRLKKFIANSPETTFCQAVNGEDALKICDSSEFDVIVVDQFMEEAGGVLLGTDVVKEMRRRKIGSVIIGCSGNDISSIFLANGCQYVWKKPMPNNEIIIKQLKNALEHVPFSEERGWTPWEGEGEDVE